jgi:hypothetical protein
MVQRPAGVSRWVAFRELDWPSDILPQERNE